MDFIKENNEYYLDLIEAAKTDKGFDKENIKELSRYYNKQPNDVKQDIALLRKQMGE